jgi:hypothetical protein
MVCLVSWSSVLLLLFQRPLDDKTNSAVWEVGVYLHTHHHRAVYTVSLVYRASNLIFVLLFFTDRYLQLVLSIQARCDFSCQLIFTRNRSLEIDCFANCNACTTVMMWIQFTKRSFFFFFVTSFPLVSGFYKMLAVTMKVANKLSYFQVRNYFHSSMFMMVLAKIFIFICSQT